MAKKEFNNLSHKKMNFDQEKDKKESIKPQQFVNSTH